jgi:hypothetical protein
MPVMYEVYSQQRPGRPRWALASSAALLLLTVLLAAALIQHKAGPGSLPLEPFATQLLQGRRPVGWKEITSELPAATELAWAEPDNGKEAGRACFIFSSPPPLWPFSTAADRVVRAAARDYAMEVFDLFAHGSRLSPPDKADANPTPGPIAGTNGLTMKFKCVAPKGQPAYCLVRCTVIAATNGAVIAPVHVLGVAVFVPGEPGLAETRLLDRMCRQLSIGGAEPGGSSDDDGS